MVVYTFGSAKWESGVGWIGEYGCHELGGWGLSSYLPPQSGRTINIAELQAGIDIVRHSL